MTPSPGAVSWRWLIAAALVGVAWQYAPLFGAGFRGDDYMILRHWTSAEIRSALSGSWDPTGFNEPYYRPLTALYQAALRPVAGLSPRTLHAWSLLLVAALAAGVAQFAARATGRRSTAWWTLAVYLSHPMLPDSTAAWIFNQFHAIEALIVVAGLLAWQAHRGSAPAGRWPVVALALVAFTWKEDGLMLIPAVIGLRWLRARMAGDVTPPSWPMLAEGAGVCAAVVALRLWVVGVTLPAAPLTSLHEWSSSVWHVTVALPWGPDAGVYVLSTPVVVLLAAGALASLARHHDPRAYLAAAGAWVILCFSLPLLSIGGPTRSHLITLGAAILFAGCIDLLWAIARTRPVRAAVAAVGLAVVASSAARTGDVLRRYLPCSPDTLTDDSFRIADPLFSDGMQQWWRDKAAACASGRPVPPMPAVLTRRNAESR